MLHCGLCSCGVSFWFVSWLRWVFVAVHGLDLVLLGFVACLFVVWVCCLRCLGLLVCLCLACVLCVLWYLSYVMLVWSGA